VTTVAIFLAAWALCSVVAALLIGAIIRGRRERDELLERFYDELQAAASRPRGRELPPRSHLRQAPEGRWEVGRRDAVPPGGIDTGTAASSERDDLTA
jgi:hypothetical protein